MDTIAAPLDFLGVNFYSDDLTVTRTMRVEQ